MPGHGPREVLPTSVPGASLLIWSDSPPVIEVTATWLSATIISDHWNRRIYTLQTYADALSTSGSSLTVDRPRMLRAIHDAIGNDHAFARRLMHTLNLQIWYSNPNRIWGILRTPSRTNGRNELGQLLTYFRDHDMSEEQSAPSSVEDILQRIAPDLDVPLEMRVQPFPACEIPTSTTTVAVARDSVTFDAPSASITSGRDGLRTGRHSPALPFISRVPVLAARTAAVATSSIQRPNSPPLQVLGFDDGEDSPPPSYSTHDHINARVAFPSAEPERARSRSAMPALFGSSHNPLWSPPPLPFASPSEAEEPLRRSRGTTTPFHSGSVYNNSSSLFPPFLNPSHRRRTFDFAPLARQLEPLTAFYERQTNLPTLSSRRRQRVYGFSNRDSSFYDLSGALSSNMPRSRTFSADPFHLVGRSDSSPTRNRCTTGGYASSFIRSADDIVAARMAVRQSTIRQRTGMLD